MVLNENCTCLFLFCTSVFRWFIVCTEGFSKRGGVKASTGGWIMHSRDFVSEDEMLALSTLGTLFGETPREGLKVDLGDFEC